MSCKFLYKSILLYFYMSFLFTASYYFCYFLNIITKCYNNVVDATIRTMPDSLIMSSRNEYFEITQAKAYGKLCTNRVKFFFNKYRCDDVVYITKILNALGVSNIQVIYRFEDDDDDYFVHLKIQTISDKYILERLIKKNKVQFVSKKCNILFGEYNMVDIY